ncbi:MAG: serine hydrolase, partial [Flavobacteriales bacterium]|nr:serine hydrolase [Flavobacteriales bacterium]
VLTVFANPYSLIDFESAAQVNTLIAAYQNSDYAQHAAAELIFGGIGANGKLPVSVSETFPAGTGLHVDPMNRFKYTWPEAVGMDASELYQIDSIAMKGVKEEAYPGCQVLVAKNGNVIYNKSFGYHTYEKIKPVQNSDIYDLASITKIGATLLSVMRLQDEGKFYLDSTLGDYLPHLIPDTSIYHPLILREILAHQAGLQAWVPFYVKTIRDGKLDTVIYRADSSTYYPLRVANNIYINKDYPDIIMQRILRGPLKEKEYRYSDLGYYFLKHIVETQSGEEIEDYVAKIYASLGMTTAGYLPRKRFSLERIPPTEYDEVFRKQVIHGDVHDPGAAMLGGVGGHAGLFSNANDLAKLMQMYLNEGNYGGTQYIKDTTVREYTKCQYCVDENRRGAGFDKPVRDGDGGPTCSCVSYLSFGHSGFTGTIAWADPEEDVVYIFLSNRIYPDAENKKLLHLNIRTDIQEVIYNAIAHSKK